MVGHDDARRLGWLGTGRMGVEMGRPASLGRL